MPYFQHDLMKLKARVLEMGTLAESMVTGAARALVEADPRLVQQVLADEPVLDGFQLQIDGEAIRLITIYAPVARDLRSLLMVARITTELERIGDQAVDNCEYVKLLPQPQPRPLPDLIAMSDIVSGMIHDALRAFRDEDTTIAARVLKLDDRVDTLDRQVFQELLEHRAGDAAARAESMSLALIARSLERMADHATNVCEEVFYLVEGADIRHRT
jgi:phosphate transport system protein